MATNRLQRSVRATVLGIAVNVILGCAKFAGGILGHSHALIADATESFADIFNSLIIWRGIVVADAPADEDHPYGHGKAEPLAAAFGAVMLLFAAVWIAFKAINDIVEVFHPQPGVFREPPRWFTLLVLGGVVLVKEGLFRFVLSEGTALENPAVTTDAWHHRSDAITSIAAAIGIMVALIGGKNFVIADDVAAIFAALVIGFNGLLLLRPAVSELMDKAPDHRLTEEVRKIAMVVPEVGRVEKCFVRKMGYQFYAEMHIEVDPQMTVLHSHEIAHEVKNRVRGKIPRVKDVLVHIEPLGIAAKKTVAVKTASHFKGWAKPGMQPPALTAGVTVEPHETLDAISGHFRLFQLRDGHRFSTDDILTAWYGTSWCPTARTALDLGSGIGTVGMISAWRLPGANFVTIEAQSDSVKLARKSAQYNGLTERYEIREGDFRAAEIICQDEIFDLITGSPPYFPPEAGVKSEHPQKLACRFELRGTVADYCTVAARHLAAGGFFACVFPHEPAQLARVEAAAREAALVIVRKRPVIFREGDAPLIALFGMMRSEDLPEWFRNQTWEEPPLTIRRLDGSIHPEYSAVKLAIGFPP